MLDLIPDCWSPPDHCEDAWPDPHKRTEDERALFVGSYLLVAEEVAGEGGRETPQIDRDEFVAALRAKAWELGDDERAMDIGFEALQLFRHMDENYEEIFDPNAEPDW